MRKHFMSQSGNIFAVSWESSAVNISQNLSQSQLSCWWIFASDSSYQDKKCQKSHLLCYMLSIAPMGFPFSPIRVSSLAISYFSLSLAFRAETVFVVTSCQRCLGLRISSNGEEAVRSPPPFFCDTVIRQPPPPISKCNARDLKVLSPVIKDSSLSVATLSDASPHRATCATQREDVLVIQRRTCLWQISFPIFFKFLSGSQ